MNISKGQPDQVTKCWHKKPSYFKQVDGVAMGSSLGPPVTNVFIDTAEEKLGCENNMLVLVCDLSNATDLLPTPPFNL